MPNLVLTTDKLRVVTANATATVDVHVSGVDLDNTTPTAQVFVPFKEPMLTITGAATTDIAAVPASSHMKNVKYVSFVNTHASITQTVQVQYDANAVLDMLTPIVTLLAGESLVCREGVWFHFDVNGGVYGPSLPLMSDTQAGAVAAAGQSDMVTATSTTLAVTPGRQRYHPSHPKVFVSCGVAADIQQSYGVSSLTDTGTGIVTVNFSTSFAATNFCAIVSVEATGTTWAIANARECHVRSATRATGSVACDCIDNTTTTNLVKDPTTWHIMAFGGQ